METEARKMKWLVQVYKASYGRFFYWYCSALFSMQCVCVCALMHVHAHTYIPFSLGSLILCHLTKILESLPVCIRNDSFSPHASSIFYFQRVIKVTDRIRDCIIHEYCFSVKAETVKAATKPWNWDLSFYAMNLG